MKKKCFLSILLFVFNMAISQDMPELPQLTPVSPNSASLARFGAYEVNANLGQVSISVPMYAIKSGSLQLPISLSYNSSGIRLNERASWVGLGWNLQAGGAIVRNVKGAPDNHTSIAREDIENLTFNEENYRYLYGVWRGYEDGQPDKYILNAYGINATFYYVERNGVEEIVFENNNSIKVTRLGAPNYGFQVIVENGTMLIFNEIETSTIPSSSLVAQPRDVPTSYYLSEIISADKKDSISFEYKTHTSFEIPVETAQSIDFSESPSYMQPLLNHNFWNNRVKIDKRYLDRVTFKSGYVQFESFLDRTDLIDEYRLDNLKVFSSIGNTEKLVKEVHLEHSYYIRGVIPTSNDYDELAKVKSLKLESVITGAIAASNSQKTEFVYDDQSLPARGSMKQDFWGYINNNTTQSLIPPTTFNMKGAYWLDNGTPNIYSDDIYPPWSVTHSAGNANRDAHPEKMKSGVLKKIIYPTGGFTEFEFEANQFKEYVTTPIYVNKSKNILALGSGDCPWPNSNCVSNGYQSLTFTVDNNPLGSPVDAKLLIDLTDAYSGSGSSNSYGKFSGLPTSSFERPAATNIYPAASYNVPISLASGGTYTIEAEEFGHGSNPPSYVPSVAVAVTWKEKTGSTSSMETKYVGGLRIKSIKNYDGVNIVPTSNKNYTYASPNYINKQRDGGYVNKYAAGNGNLKATLSSSPSFDNGIGVLPAIEYGEVTEYHRDENGVDNGKKVYTYEKNVVERDIVDTRELYKHPLFDIVNDPIIPNSSFGLLIDEIMNNEDDIADRIIKPFNQGSIKKIEYYKRDITIDGEPSYKLISEEEYDYNTVDESNFKLNFVYSLKSLPMEAWNTSIDPYDGEISDLNSYELYFKTRKIYLGKKLLTSTVNRQYDSNGENPMEVVKNFSYNNDYLLSETTTTNSQGQIIRTKNYYPDDVTSSTSLGNDDLTASEMVTISLLQSPSEINPNGQHRISTPIQTETRVESSGVLLSKSTQRTSYRNWGGNLVLPETVKTLKGEHGATNTLEDRVKFHSYYANGNVKELSKDGGTKIVYIWGYNEEFPIAKIENATYAEVQGHVSNLQTLSNSDDDRTVGNVGNEGALRAALESLRSALPNAQVSTYTYDPLIGVTSMTDPRGYVMYYEYDALNRLEHVKDKEGNILSKNQYNYATQN